jgi:ParB-like chromosome segregation protein Spo0J
MVSMNKKKSERRKLVDLKVNPLQSQLVRPMPSHALDALARKFRKAQAIDHPIHILPDGTIVDGHMRCLAAQRAGLVEVDVIVRHDLVDDPIGVERVIVESHQHRKHLDPLDHARLIRRQIEIKNKRQPGGLGDYERREARDTIATQLGITSRHADRLLHVLDALMPLQAAVSAGHLSIVLAERVARLDKSVQEQIADAIDRGDKPKAVVAEHLTRTATPKSAQSGYYMFLRALDLNYAALDSYVERLELPLLDHAPRIATLERGIALLTRLRRREQIVREEFGAALAKAMPYKRAKN